MTKRAREDDDVSADDDDLDRRASASPAKIIGLDKDESAPANSTTMQCSLPPHRPLTFASAEDFDTHYTKEHTYRCSSCGKNFPSAHYLSLHIDENHNPVREALAAKGEKTYACFIEDCEKLCSTPQKRRLHLIDKHMFPKVYNFRIIDQGIDKTNSLLQGGQRRRVSTTDSSAHRRRPSLLPSGSAISEHDAELSSAKASPSQGKVEKPGTNGDGTRVDELEQSFAALKFVPPSVQAKHRCKK
ncbi:hypothetical protein PMZ80_002661 [Knufia obscura]|uniref:C2H2-type domain-containing protein n=2 Tax=Knufia TaxID=430999 RepID=A0AAN8EBV8_9EURO|nr:hypothetical protein PMZ80_002661 [Knufia obscura]KAK5951438.1 hypothetical protein OHC33_007494 [Knufia fluminis]